LARSRAWSGPRRALPGPVRELPGPAGPPTRTVLGNSQEGVCHTRAEPNAPGLRALGSRRVRQLREGDGIGDGQLGEDLAIETDPRLLESVHEGRVREPGLAARSVDADDPQRARPALLLLAPLVGEDARAQDSLRRGAVELAPSAEVALRLLENLLTSLAG